MVDRDLVTRKLAMIVDDLRAVTPIADKPIDEYLASATDELVTERYLERMIGRMIDVNYHVITASGQPPPADYHTSFLKLADLGILDADFARRIARAAGLRNRLVHDYEDLDQVVVFEALEDALRDLPVYLARLNAYVKGGPIL